MHKPRFLKRIWSDDATIFVVTSLVGLMVTGTVLLLYLAAAAGVIYAIIHFLGKVW